MSFNKVLRRVFRKIKRKMTERYPKRSRHEKHLIEEFIEKRLDEAGKQGWLYATFDCTIEGGEVIYDKKNDIQLKTYLHDYERFVKKYIAEIRYVDSDFYRVKRQDVQHVEIFF